MPPTVMFLSSLYLKLVLRAGEGVAKAWADRFVVVDFADPNIGGLRYNPLEPQDGLTIEETVGDFLRCLERVIGDLVEMRRLQMVLRAVCTLVARLGGTTLRDVVDFLCMDTEDIHAYLRRLEERRSAGRLSQAVRPDLVHQYMAQFFANTSGRERRELVQSSINALSVFLTDAVAARFVSSPNGNISFSGIVNGGRWLLVHLPRGLDLNTQKVLGALIVNRIQLVAERRTSADVESGRVPPFSLIVDEFQMMMGRHWAEAIAFTRNKNLNLCCAHQCGSQPPFDTEDGKSLLRAVEANSSVHAYFRLHIEDAQRHAIHVFRPDGHRLKRDEVQVSETRSVSWAETVSKSVTRTISEAFGESVGLTRTFSIGKSTTIGFSEANGVSRVDTETMSLARGENWTRATSKADGVTVTVTASETIVEGHGKSRGQSHGHSSGGDHASFNSAVNSVITHSRSMANGMSHSFGNARTRTTSTSKGGSETSTTGNAVARGLSQVKSRMDSLARTVSIATALQQARSHTTTLAKSAGDSIGQQKGGSYSRATTRIREFYSVYEEAQVRAYELAELPRREAWVWINDSETASFKIRTHDIPQNFVTRLGGRDFVQEFLSRATSDGGEEEPAQPFPARALARGAR
ncbi:MAG: hypothetical protein U0263_31430 [Polyangiaceae bacterium]